MAVQHGVWGIDVGQSAVKALRLELIDNVVTATAFDFIEHPKILSQPDADPDQLTREALEKFLSRNNLKGDLVAISVPGQSGLARFVKLPPVEEKKIADIVRFEAKQQIPFPLDEVVWDFQKIGAGEVTDGFAMETEIGLFAMKRDQISRQLSHFQDVNIEVNFIQMAPLALINYVAYDLLNKGGPGGGATEEVEDQGPRGKRRCVVALDIGTDSSSLVVTDGEKIIWQRPIPLGGNHMTRALSKELKLTFAKAEHLKRNAAKSPPELKTILTALKPVLSDFVGEVQRSLGFFTNTHRDAQVQYMVGLGSAFRLPGFQKYLSEKLQLEVRKPGTFNRVTGEEVTAAPVFTENVLSFGVAYGLAVQGLGVAKLRTNLLPQEIQFDRMIRAKKPWAVAAASALFLGAGLLAGGYALNYNSVAAKSITEALGKAKSKLDEVNKLNTDASTKESEVTKTTQDVKAVIAGKDEQLNWILLNQYLNRCLPQPDGSNLKVNVRTGNFWGPQVPYWRTQPAQEALQMYRDRIRGGQTADQPMPEDIRENLVEVDVEAIETRFTDNLKGFYDTAKQVTTSNQGAESALAGMCKYDVDNPPKEGDKGWIIEVRGSTYHHAGRTFIIDTLVQNLARFGRSPKLPLLPDPNAPPPADKDSAGGGTSAPAASTPAPADTPDTSFTPGDPITDRVTHVFLYNWKQDYEPVPGTYQLISATSLTEVIAPAGGGMMGMMGRGEGPGGMGPGGMPGGGPGGAPAVGEGGAPGGAPGGSSLAAWAPLSGAGGGGGMMGGGERGGTGPGGMGRSMMAGLRGKLGGVAGGGGVAERGGSGPRGPGGPGGPGGRGFLPGPGGMGGPPNVGEGGTGAEANVRKPKPRYEFVVMFIWREPTPSDQLMKLDNPDNPTPSP